jgi:purine-binding chemotaxis protein CheW
VRADAFAPSDLAASGAAYLTLRTLDQAFALPIEFARSAFKIEALTRVPQAPPHLLGLSIWRGGIVAIVCLARRLDRDALPLGVGAIAVSIELDGETFALAVQEIGDILHARAEDISEAASHVDLQHSALMAGVLRSGAMLIPILDPFGVFDICRRAEAA